MTPESVLVKITEDGRKVEVSGRWLCLDGRPEAERLLKVSEHPNRAAILRAIPTATHVAGRLPLTADEAAVAQAALDAHARSPGGVAERLRQGAWQRVLSADVD